MAGLCHCSNRHPKERMPTGHTSPLAATIHDVSIKHRLPLGGAKKKGTCTISSSLIPSRVETLAFGNARKNRAVASLSSSSARCAPMQTSRRFQSFPLALVLVSSNVEIVLTTGSTAERHEPVLHLLRRRGPPVWVKLLCVGVYIRVTMQTPCLRRDNRPA